MRTCEVEDCGRAHVARGLCKTHYNQKHQPNRHAKATVSCARCGTPCEKQCEKQLKRSRPRQYCSLTCRTDDQFAAARSRKALVHVGPPWPRTEIPARHPCRRPAPRRPEWWTVLIAGSCGWCGAYFVGRAAGGGTAPRYCSKRCRTSVGKNRGGRFLVPAAVRLAIYERDGWVCQLCNGAVDRDLGPSDLWGATLDHVVCQSWGTPDHSPENLRLAHRWCNSVRGDERYYTAAVLAA